MEIADFADKNPFVRITVPLMLGIILCNSFTVPPSVSLIVLCVLATTSIVAYKRCRKYKYRWIPGMFLFFTFFVFGYNLMLISTPAEISSNVTNTRCEYRACITNTPSEGDRAYKADLRLEAVKVFGEWQNFDAKIVATITKDSLARKLRVGQTIIFTSKIDSLATPKNPFGFDYSQYLQLNGVQGSIFLNPGEWQIDSETIHGIKLHALNARQRLVSTLEDAGLSGNELGLASTLVLGYKNPIDSEIKQAYMNAGAMHVLAVSGMHVGIVCAVLELLMTILGGRYFFSIKRVFIILMLWAYAFITGLSPSVMRATLMFSFMMAARSINRNISIYNSLAASAFVLLAIDPTQLFKAGFQLSYAAVIGIVFFQPRIAALVKINNKPLKYIWELTAVSISAQIATFPFCLYYFERTPVYFWLSNIIVSPGAAIMISLTMLLLVVSPVACLTKIVGEITSIAAKTMNFLVVSIANLPYSTIENRYITVFQSIMIAVAIISATIWIVKHNHQGLVAALCAILLFIIPISVNKIKSCETRAVCVYYSPKNPSVQFIDGLKSYWTCNIVTANNKMNSLVKGGNNFWNSICCKRIADEPSTQNGNISIKNGFFRFGNLCGLLINDSTKRFEFNRTDTLDLLIVTGEPKIKAKQMAKDLCFRKIVIDASVPPWIAQDWSHRYSKFPIHYTKKDGAFIHIIE